LSRSSSLVTEPELGESTAGRPAGFCSETDMGGILYEMLKERRSTGRRIDQPRDAPGAQWR
jgi:hypothetical protein